MFNSSRDQPTVPLPTYTPITEQPRGLDLFRLPGLRRFIRWKYARFALQLPLLILAVFVIWDGLSGRQVAPRNLATTSSWLHYRGLVVIALALFGNAFCAACPLMLTRGASKGLKRLLPLRLKWPAFLKNKYLVTGLLLLIFISYEYFDLWASPWLTAWLAVAYFAAALAIDSLFPAGTFCRYVCPLGNFNFLYAAASPSQITAIDHDVCRRCEHKPCLHGRETHASEPPHRSGAFIPLTEITRPNGSGHFPGCETNLFVPTITSNMDCTYCFNCVRACPYDNVALSLRAPGRELWRQPYTRRGGLALIVMAILLASWGVLNAGAMIGPYFSMAQGLADLLNTRSELVVLSLLFFLVGIVGLALTSLLSVSADRLGGIRSGPLTALMRWGYVLIPLGFGFWAAHYLFHFMTGALSIIPVFEHFFWYRGVDIVPRWQLAALVPNRLLFPFGAGIVTLYSLLALTATVRIGLRDFGRRGVLAMWPMLLFVLAFAALSVWILGQPMEMRGTIFGPSF